MRLALVMVRTLINFLLPTLRHESLTSAHQLTHWPECRGAWLTGWKYSLQSMATVPDECIGVVVGGAGAARAGIIVRGKPDKLDLSRGLICLDTNNNIQIHTGDKNIELNIYFQFKAKEVKREDNLCSNLSRLK